MQIRNHIRLLSWTAADKLLFLGYGVVTWLQIRALSPVEYGLAAQLLTLQAWIAIVAEGSLLQSIIQYGHDQQDRGRADLIALGLHTVFTLALAVGIAAAASPLAQVFNEQRFHSVATILPLYCLIGIPRSFALKLLQRELRARDVFLTNLAWLGTATVLTIYFLTHDRLRYFEDMALIACVGLTAGSVVGSVLARDLYHWSLEGTLTLRAVLRFSVPQALMMALATSIRQLDIFIVQAFFSTRAVGVYNAAKMLYRVFETGADAAVWLMYPTAVRLLHQERRDALNALVGKSLILQCAVVFAAVFTLEAGGTKFFVGFLGAQYSETTTVFNVMAIGALFLPVMVLQSVLLALHRVDRMLGITAISVIAAVAVYIIVGVLDLLPLIGTGVVMYAAAMGFLLWYAVRREGLVAVTDLVQAMSDIRTAIGVFMQRRFGIVSPFK
ncbi:MAG: oligosaccharide flippase family protein [Chlorobi bacterium]|nr:oligosaccharide flippase family protein [Chlorobiota bacterium]